MGSFRIFRSVVCKFGFCEVFRMMNDGILQGVGFVWDFQLSDIHGWDRVLPLDLSGFDARFGGLICPSQVPNNEPISQ